MYVLNQIRERVFPGIRGLQREGRGVLRAFYDWAVPVVLPEDVIAIFWDGKEYLYQFDFPLCHGNVPRRIRALPAGAERTFMVDCDRERDATAHAERRKPDGSWIAIFESREIGIDESKHRRIGIPPLRWGLSEDEKKAALRIAHHALERFLSTGIQVHLIHSYFRDVPLRFFLQTDLDVAIWLHGELRGSVVLENRRLADGIAEAVVLAARDRRFKPVAKGELDEVRIEITMMHNLRIPLWSAAYEADEIDATKGYMLAYGGKKGWYLPEVHNVRRFHDLREFLASLAERKAGLNATMAQKAEVFVFAVDDFIESRDHSRAITLHGPVPQREAVPAGARHDGTAIPMFFERFAASADQLCRIQERDGNMPAITDPLTGRIVRRVDWPRLALSAWALGEFGKKVSEARYVASAEKAFDYLRMYLLDKQFTATDSVLTLAYFGQLARMLGRDRETAEVAARMARRLPSVLFEPIMYAQVASFFQRVRHTEEQTVLLHHLYWTLKSEFERRIKSGMAMNLAVWAELVNVFRETDPEFSARVADWLLRYQLPDGAFLANTTGGVPYTRGTGKIIEALGAWERRYDAAILSAMAFLSSMQYREEHMFFIPEVLRRNAEGAFRHDYCNMDMWIDASGHVLLCGSRLISA